MIKHYLQKIAIVSTLLLTSAQIASAASAWPANSTATANIASGLTAYNATEDGFEASGVEYLANYGYIVNGDDGDIAVLSSQGAVLHYWFPGGDLEDVTVTDTTANDNKIYLANEFGSKIEEFSLTTGAKTGLSWTLSDLPVSGSDGLEALAYIPAAYAPASWGTAQSGGFFVAASQAEAKLRVYTFSRSSSASITSVKQITVDYTNVAALNYSTSTGLLYIVFDGADRLKEYNLSTGTIVGSYYLPTYGLLTSDEGMVIVPNCATGKADIALADDAVSSSVKVYANYPITCTAATPTTVDADADGVASTSDCNDNDATISSNRTYYRDADGDGLGLSSSTTSVCSLTAPSGYVSNSSDSNDSDYDNDGVGTSSDCNDADSAISAYQTYYRDADGDGLGTSTTTSVVCSYTVTSGYVTNSSDSNDSDYDNDGVSTSSDCNDADSAISAYQTYYRDADGDGLGNPAVTSVVCSYTITTGYVTNSTDLNDSDYDNDGVSTSSDCNDLDSSVSALLTVYQDFDGDGLGNPNVSQQVCATTAPTGYVTNNTDTDDSGVVPEPTPEPTPTYSAVEYLANSIDDDGDGKVDEWNTLAAPGVHPVYGSYDASSTSLYASTVTSIAGASNGDIKVKFVDGSGYRYKVFSVSTSRLTKVSSYNGTAYLLVRNASGRKTALVNAYTGEVSDVISAAKGSAITLHWKTLTLHHK
ncbi:MAG: hypothetical protein HY565_04145 [Candidatus Kerfeldbacteria bacterium]|nr:hypothetical protein [Candidatus Kerfeldbacteria bacterium]